MKITRIGYETLDYSELSVGDVFVTECDEETVYMETEHGAVNLEDGYFYNIEDEEPVRKLDAELIVR